MDLRPPEAWPSLQRTNWDPLLFSLEKRQETALDHHLCCQSCFSVDCHFPETDTGQGLFCWGFCSRGTDTERRASIAWMLLVLGSYSLENRQQETETSILKASLLRRTLHFSPVHNVVRVQFVWGTPSDVVPDFIRRDSFANIFWATLSAGHFASHLIPVSSFNPPSSPIEDRNYSPSPLPSVL